MLKIKNHFKNKFCSTPILDDITDLSSIQDQDTGEHQPSSTSTFIQDTDSDYISNDTCAYCCCSYCCDYNEHFYKSTDSFCSKMKLNHNNKNNSKKVKNKYVIKRPFSSSLSKIKPLDNNSVISKTTITSVSGAGPSVSSYETIADNKRGRSINPPNNSKRQLNNLKVLNICNKYLSTSDLVDKSNNYVQDDLKNLWTSFSNLNLNLVKNIDLLPDHDKKIINRMAMKRSKELAMMEDACIARKYWEEEKMLRDEYINQQNETFTNILKEKRRLEYADTQNRLRKIAEEEHDHREQIKQEILEKNLKTKCVLDKIKYETEIQKSEKQSREIRRNELLAINSQTLEFNNDYDRQLCNERLEKRITKADLIRNKLIQIYRTRLINENQMQQELHAANFMETKKQEKYRLKKLKEKLDKRDKKYKRFIETKRRTNEASQNQAKTTAFLRDIVKRAMSPENYNRSRVISSLSNNNDRSYSNLSYTSHLKLS